MKDQTYVLGNAAILPSVSVDDLAKIALVVEPGLRTLERGLERRDFLLVPNRRKHVPCIIESVLNRGVVVLWFCAVHG